MTSLVDVFAGVRRLVRFQNRDVCT
jgi:hypothetical protein